MSKILILETSTEVCSVALSENGNLIDFIESVEGQNHAKLVSVFANDLLQRNGLSATDLLAVAVSRGPGSYTGLRIGVSTAKGICYGAKIPLIAISTLESMAIYISENRTEFKLPTEKPLIFCPMIDARRMEVYTMLIDNSGRIIENISANIVDDSFLSQELNENIIVFFGSGAEKCKDIIKSDNACFIDNIRASAQYMCKLAYKAYLENNIEDLAYFEPFYLKDFVAISPKNKIF